MCALEICPIREKEGKEDRKEEKFDVQKYRRTSVLKLRFNPSVADDVVAFLNTNFVPFEMVGETIFFSVRCLPS